MFPPSCPETLALTESVEVPIKLGFIKSNIKSLNARGERGSLQYTSKPQLEYGAAIWGPHNKSKINQGPFV